jgi:branched-chain amino acid transport system permease protein
VIFLAFTLVVGEGGMIWACEVTFAGVGAIAAAQLATVHGWPLLAALAVGPLVAVPMGVLIGLLTIRLGTLYVTLVTLMFGLLMDNLVFSQNVFAQQGLGVALERPGFATSDRALVYLGLVVFCGISLFIVNLRRSTTGLALSAVRSSEAGARTIGVSVLQMKVLVAGAAAFVAGVGGVLLSMNQGSALPLNFATLAGVIWLAVLVTAGIRSNMAALAAGLLFAILPALTLEYLPKSFNQLPPILFGLGAILVAKNPDGWLTQQAEQLRSLWERSRRRGARPRTETLSGPLPQTPAPVGADNGAHEVGHLDPSIGGTPESPRR